MFMSLPGFTGQISVYKSPNTYLTASHLSGSNMGVYPQALYTPYSWSGRSPGQNAAIGAAIGGVLGGLIGGFIGSALGGGLPGAVTLGMEIGGAIGGAIGAAIGWLGSIL
jgi:hypothetical protein